MRPPYCYVVNTKQLDMSGAEVYGKIITLYDKAPGNFFNTGVQLFYIKQHMKDIQENDYLVMSGNLVLVALAWGVIYERFGYVNVLLYDKVTNAYTPRVIPRHQLIMTKEGK